MSLTQEAGKKKCAHRDCQCLVEDDKEFCSDYCKIAGEEEYCGCGHAKCNTEFANRTRAQEHAA